MKNHDGHAVLLGSVGGDSHSVGLQILRQALSENGYYVYYLGNHNKLKDFFELAYLCNVVMISNMDGHAWLYLQEFPVLKNQFNLTRKNPLWYLGGNLTIGDSLGHEKHYYEMGFDCVFVKFCDVLSVLEHLEKDLRYVTPKIKAPFLFGESKPFFQTETEFPLEKSIQISKLEQARPEALQYWDTGHEAYDLEKNAEFLSRQPSFSQIQGLVHAGKRKIIIQPRCGVALVNDQIKFFRKFKKLRIPVLSYQVDSLTRNNNYVGADEAIRESHISQFSLLNGFPVINHGVSQLQRIISEVGLPLQTRHSSRDPRLLAEISYAGGVTSYEGGAICYNIPYYKDYPLFESISKWQYVDRLTGLYFEKFGIVLDREFFGTLTGTLIPPSLAIVVCIVESILALQQGVKCVSLGYAEQGHRIQDVAAIKTMASMASEIFPNLGYKDVQINTVFHQYMAAFPTTPELAEELIFNSAVTASLSGATRILTKTPVEAYKIPTLEDNIEGLNLVKAGIKQAAKETINSIRLGEECEIIRSEVNAIFDSILLIGKGNLIKGIISAFQEGFIDIPFSSSKYNAGKVMTARDVEGAVRFVNFGNLQFDRELKEFHQDKMSERRRIEGVPKEKLNYILVEKDVLKIARGQYEKWPLFTKRN